VSDLDDYVYGITTYGHPELAAKAVASLLPHEQFEVFDVKASGLKSLAAAWNHLIKKFVIDEKRKAVIIMADDVECEDPRPTGKALLGVLEKYGALLNIIMTVGYDVNLWGNKGLTAMPGSIILPGANCMCITKRLVDEIGLFDERYKRAWFEDTDMWQRIYGHGYEVASVAPIRHVGSATTAIDPEAAKAKLKYYPENYARYIKKWGGPPGQELNPTAALRNNHRKQ
jgi:hypothetical protein